MAAKTVVCVLAASEAMLSSTPTDQVLGWVADAIGPGAKVVSAKSLHGGGRPPWLLDIEHEGSRREVVLRVSRGFPFHITTGAAALRVAEQHGLAAPRLVAADLDGRAAGVPATLETVVVGSSASPAQVSAERLMAAGAGIAKAHKVRLEPQRYLPRRIRSLQGPAQLDELALERRWAALYRSTAERERHSVLEALSELTGWSIEHAGEVMLSTRFTPLLQLADDTLRAIPPPGRETVFVHADLWAGNMMWNGDTDVTLIDWKDAGVGDPGVDVGHLRMKMAVQYGLAAASYVLDGWQHEMDREATDVPYWDVVAALHTPTQLDDWEPGFDNQGRQLTSDAVTERRDAFLREALDRLDRSMLRLRHLDVNAP